jgi:hypothetical protein
VDTDRSERRNAGDGTASVSGLLRDVRGFLLASPPSPTAVPAATLEERRDLSGRIQQRVGIDVTPYSILNIHHIGIDAPGRAVFGRIMSWDGDSSYWPNHIARATRLDEGLHRIDIHLFGWRRFLGLGLKPLFRLEAARILEEPGPGDPDNHRFVMFRCEGGYPIGHFIMYVRSSIPVVGETGTTQLFLAVGFNVYGRRRLARAGPARLVTALWERLHNRVTSHVLHRLKALCEDDLRGIESGRGLDPASDNPRSFT